jgi:Polyketide cyclase / dehydrase and lipid transport
MRFEERLFVARPVKHVWAFFEDLSNLPRWDRGVARVEVTSWTGGVGTTSDTFAKNDRGRMSYEVTEAEPNRRYPAVTRSGLFRLAQWQFDVEAADHGTSVACVSDFALRFRYLLLAPVFALLVGRAIRRDLAQLELVIQGT